MLIPVGPGNNLILRHTQKSIEVTFTIHGPDQPKLKYPSADPDFTLSHSFVLSVGTCGQNPTK